MNTALFIKDGITREITAESISSRKEYLETYCGHLYCPIPNCPAHVSFAETPTFTIKKIFKTSKNSVHSDNCPHKISHDTNGNRYISSEAINQALSERHKRDILKKLFYRNQNPDDEKSPGGASTKTKAKAPLSDADAIPTPKVIASIDPNAEPAEKGQREPVVKKRHCADVLPEDIGKLLGLDDYAKSAYVSDDYVEILLESNTTLLFYNSFRDSSPAAFSLVKGLATDFLKNKQTLLICFIGNIEKKETGYQIQIMDPSLITFNDRFIYDYKKTN